MQLKKLIQAMVIGGTVLALAACSAPWHKKSAAQTETAADMNGGAMAQGAGSGSGYGDMGGPQASIANRTYYFDFDSNVVHDSDKSAINANANYLLAHSDAKVIVEGHTDPRGSREYNIALGERRANAVAEILEAKGVNRSQIRVVSYGAQRLAADGRDEESYRQDRRAVIVYTQN